MQQFWYSIKKVQGTDSYEFLLANTKCVVNADVFRIIPNICPRVKGVDFADVPDDDATLAFLIELRYKVIIEYLVKPIRLIQDFDESKDQFLTLKNTSYLHQRYTVYNTLVNEEESISFTSIRCIHQEDMAYPCLYFTNYHEGLETQYAVKMDDPNITMEEYIRLEEEKARRRAIAFNDTLIFEDYTPTVSCFDDLDFFKDFESEFLAIVYNDPLTSKSDFLIEPTVSPQHIDEFNLKDETSLPE
ncbi:hypothetical protein Tco_1538610 [Tanacetum coccineum]